jgi:EAL domain-containing protein (putative c-di-GMP-specific phosphodiesterase class I)
MRDINESCEQLTELQRLGIVVSLDDFGTGYSSLSYLERLPIDILKIDQSFVRRINKAESSRTLVQAIVALAHSLRMKAVAEGVESESQLAALRIMGCDIGQGFYLGRPISADSIQSMLSAQTTQSLVTNPITDDLQRSSIAVRQARPKAVSTIQ